MLCFVWKFIVGISISNLRISLPCHLIHRPISHVTPISQWRFDPKVGLISWNHKNNMDYNYLLTYTRLCFPIKSCIDTRGDFNQSPALRLECVLCDGWLVYYYFFLSKPQESQKTKKSTTGLTWMRWTRRTLSGFSGDKKIPSFLTFPVLAASKLGRK